MGHPNRLQTYVSIKLALRVLNDFDPIFSWHVFSQYLDSLNQDKLKILTDLQDSYKKIELLEAENAKLHNNPVQVDLKGGSNLLYGYKCNDFVK